MTNIFQRVIALLLGRLRMPLRDVEKFYIEFGTQIFSSKKIFGSGKFKSSVFEERIKEIVKRVTGSHDPETRMSHDWEFGCNTCVVVLEVSPIH